MDLSKYKGLYLQETREHLSGVEEGLLVLEKDPHQAATIDNLFRHFHSIKGMSASMGYEPLKLLAHALEDLLDRIRKGFSVTEKTVSTLLQCVDGLKVLVKRVEDDQPLDVSIEPFITKIKETIEGKAEDKGAALPVPAAAQSEPELTLSKVMKVEGKVFDDLLAIVGDLFMVLSSFKSQSHRLRSIEFKDGVHFLGKAVSALHGNILSARMLPIEDLTAGLPRVVRDVSRGSGKEVSLNIEGAEISLDRAILESLGSPMVHIIRNAVDHGIETPAEREAMGKPPCGQISIKAFGRKDHVVLAVEDDGRGIDVERIKAKAVEKGMDAAKVNSLSDKEALMLVCMPGLSGSEKVTETSGRGVGMDVVKDTIESIGGTLAIDSTRGKGTRFTLELPRTTSIIKALTVTVGPEIFLIPMSRIEKVLETESAGAVGGFFQYNGADVPVVPIAGLLGMDPSYEGPSGTIIIVEASTGVRGKAHYLGLMADGFGDEIDAYIKPLLPPYSKLWGVSGITIMGDGRPVFLLDIQQIASRALA